ncbi:hypothetical protein F2Q68_00005462 [Brassica cretica]|uniref:Uncharacterized protein n=1 Tax=Brassica cretica TaxID=69181 RepID=A0A8S9JD49_BRACR|nr:hypothetical protein F2Q68_00005462 [Brassica cretica]
MCEVVQTRGRSSNELVDPSKKAGVTTGVVLFVGCTGVVIRAAEVVTIDGWVEVVATNVEVLAGWSEVATINGLSEVVATSVEALARWSEVATIDGLPEVVATSVEVLARWSEIVIAASCALVIPGWSVVAEIGASGCAVGSVTAELS